MKLNEIVIEPLLDTLFLGKIEDKEYFSPKYKNYVSNSRLGLLNPKQGGSPEKFMSGFKSGFSQSLVNGSAVHEMILQPEYFEMAPDLGHPTAKLGGMADALYPLYKEGKPITETELEIASNEVGYWVGKSAKWKNIVSDCTPYWEARKQYENEHKSEKELIYLDTKNLEICTKCIQSLQDNTEVQKLLHPEELLDSVISENEQAITLDVKCTGPDGKSMILPLKSKLDNYTITGNKVVINDVKTLGKILSKMDENIINFHYSREFAFYGYLLDKVCRKIYGMTDFDISCNYLIVSTIPDYYSKTRPVFYKELQQGLHEFKTLIRYVAYLMLYKGYSWN